MPRTAGCEGLGDAGAVAVVDGFEEFDVRGCHPVAGAAQMPGGCPVTSPTPAALESFCPLAIAGTDPTMDPVQVNKRAKLVFNRIPDACPVNSGYPAQPE